MRILLGITGASGSIYAVQLIRHLREGGHEIHLIVTHSGESVMAHECPDEAPQIEALAHCRYDVADMGAAVASGSFEVGAMVIVPCSMKTAACIANGISDNLLTRAADVTLKEGRPLLIVPRETPMSAIHLENLLRLARAGARILPACPAFYHQPETIEDLADMMAGKILDALHIDNHLFARWPLGVS